MNHQNFIRTGLGAVGVCLLLMIVLRLFTIGQSAVPVRAASEGNGGIYLPLVVKPFPLGLTSRVSVASDGTEGNDNSALPSISADGRYVAFFSDASSLVSGDTNDVGDVFVHDSQTGQTSRISVTSDGTQASLGGGDPAISADGRYVAFVSRDSNLVSGDTNNAWDIFVHDRQTGLTTRVSIASDGTQGNGDSRRPMLSADGRYVSFDSYASNLVTNDNNASSDIFVHDLQTGLTTRVSVASDGTEGNGESGDGASISADGRYIVFSSWASNLVSDDTNNAQDIFVHDRQTGLTTRVSVASDGTEGNSYSRSPAISGDGRYVTFWSMATTLANGTAGTFLHDRQTGETSLLIEGIGDTSISHDGLYIAIATSASNLVSGDTNNTSDVFLYDQQTKQIRRVSVASDGTQGNDYSVDPSISADGRNVAFYSQASNLINNDTNNAWDVFVHDLGE